MRNKGFFTTIVLVMIALSFYYFSNTFYAKKIEGEAEKKATISKNGQQYVDQALLKKQLDSISIADTLGMIQFKSATERQIKLGLDLKGGMNVLLEVSEKDIIRDLANNSTNPIFTEAISLTDAQTKNTNSSYTDTFFNNFKTIKKAKNSNIKLASSEIFGSSKLANTVAVSATDAEVEAIVKSRVTKIIDEARDILESRIDKFGVASPIVQKVQNSNRINVELPGVKDTERIKKMLQSTAKLEFFTLDMNSANFFNSVNQLALGSKENKTADTIATADSVSNNTAKSKFEKFAENKTTKKEVKKAAFITFGQGYALANIADTARINTLLKSEEARKSLNGMSRYTRFLWGSEAIGDKKDQIQLYALLGDRYGEPTLKGDIVENAKVETNPTTNEIMVGLQMTLDGAKEWARVTKANVGRQLAIVLDNTVYSAPRINGEMNTGSASITGNFNAEEASDLAGILNAGKMPASAKIVQAEVVGPSLGQDTINAGMLSFLVAFAVVCIYMVFYFGGSGFIANLSLIFNMVLVLGIVIDRNVTLTMPGIAGIVLTIAMAVDANVLIFDRIKEELLQGKERMQAIADGFKYALPSILDANILNLLSACVLAYFGQGPVRGFAITLIIGILSALFASLIVSRLLINLFPNVSFYTSITKNWFTNINFDFIGKRKIGYIVSIILTLAGLVSLFTRNLDYGVDFVGGRTYNIRFEKPVDATELTKSLTAQFVEDGNTVAPQIKPIGLASENKVKIITKYKINSDKEDTQIEKEIIDILYKGTKQYLPANMNRQAFEEGAESKTFGMLSYSKVGPSVADGIRTTAGLAVSISLVVIFFYILLRFRKWQFSIGAIVALIHDTIMVLGAFSLLKNIVPFSVEVDQAFVAAILTVMGYSLNDTVIVFDRVREDMHRHSNWPFGKLMNHALNSTLSRTLTTSLITLTVILIIFFFGGDSIKGFMFALAVGIGVGTYSSLFIASPLAYDLLGEREKRSVENTSKEKK